MKLARTIRFDESDERVFDVAAQSDEWAISGGFAFSNIQQDDLTGKTRQAFANGWLGLESFGRSTFVAIAQIEPFEVNNIIERLSVHFVEVYGAPSVEAARPVAEAEIRDMIEACEAHKPNTLLSVERTITGEGIREVYRVIETEDASIDILAVHGTL